MLRLNRETDIKIKRKNNQIYEPKEANFSNEMTKKKQYFQGA